METKATLYPYQNLCSKYLFAVVLLLSFFNFSGFSIAPVQVKNESQQTGRLGNTDGKTTKRLSYKRALIHFNHLKYGSLVLTKPAHYLATHHTLLINLVIRAHSKTNICLQKSILFHHTITLSKNDDDDDLKC